MARRIIAAVLCGYVLNSLLGVVAADLPNNHLQGFVACLIAVLALQFLHSTSDTLEWPPWVRLVTLAAQAVFTFLPILWVGAQASAVAGFLAGSMLLTVPGRVRWALYIAVGAAVWLALSMLDGLTPLDVVYGTYFILLTGLMVYGVSSLASLVSVVYSARGELARTAVARERLRVARDLHDLLGFNVSAMTLRSELAYRLLPRALDLAKQELTEVLRIARHALADVRAVASGYQPMSLAAEVESAEAMLSAVEIHTDVRIVPGDVRPEVETVLAIVLREAVTNVLRHGKAERCTITATREPGRIRLQVSNDGAEPDVGPGPDTGDGRHGTGLANLADRLGLVGGALATSVDGQWFHLTAEIPLAPGRAPRALLDDPSLPETAGGGTSRWRRNRPWHLRVARLVAGVVILGYAALIVVNVLPAAATPVHLIGFAACVAVGAGILMTCALTDVRRWPAWQRIAVLVPQTVVTVLPLAWLGDPWGSMGGPLGATILLVLARRIRWPLFILVGAGVAALGSIHTAPGAFRAYLIISTLLTGLALYGIGSLSRLVVQVNHAHAELTRMAVTRERLRVARNLHDVLGRDLSRIAVAGRTAHRYVEEEPDLAKEEVAEVLDIARRAVAKVRAVASGYRRMSLAAEIDSAVSVLEAARIDVHVHLPDREVPDEVDSVLAVALREAVMNVLRHSEAHWCGIEVEFTGERVRLDVANDGAGTLDDPALDSGSGLGDLAARMELVGGTVAGASDGGRFQLSIELPIATGDRIARSFAL